MRPALRHQILQSLDGLRVLASILLRDLANSLSSLSGVLCQWSQELRAPALQREVGQHEEGGASRCGHDCNRDLRGRTCTSECPENTYNSTGNRPSATDGCLGCSRAARSRSRNGDKELHLRVESRRDILLGTFHRACTCPAECRRLAVLRPAANSTSFGRLQTLKRPAHDGETVLAQNCRGQQRDHWSCVLNQP